MKVGYNIKGQQSPHEVGGPAYYVFWPEIIKRPILCNKKNNSE